MKHITILLIVFSLCVGCADSGPKTTTGAVAGGVVGAGLGAIVGNQTGSTGGGLAIGAVAGSAAGAAIGGALDIQDEKIDEQNQMISRQKHTIQSQSQEIENLRQLSRDRVSFRNEPALGTGRSLATSTSPRVKSIPGKQVAAHTPEIRWKGNTPVSAGASLANDARGSVRIASPRPVGGAQIVSPGVPVVSSRPITERSLTSSSSTGRETTSSTLYEARGDTYQKKEIAQMKKTSPITTPQNTTTKIEKNKNTVARNINPVQPDSWQSECSQAEGEVKKARSAEENSDRLFHYLRALRLCPSNPGYHNELGELYLSLNRADDAREEFNEAISLDPNFRKASDNLQKLGAIVQ